MLFVPRRLRLWCGHRRTRTLALGFSMWRRCLCLRRLSRLGVRPFLMRLVARALRLRGGHWRWLRMGQFGARRGLRRHDLRLCLCRLHRCRLRALVPAVARIPWLLVPGDLWRNYLRRHAPGWHRVAGYWCDRRRHRTHRRVAEATPEPRAIPVPVALILDCGRRNRRRHDCMCWRGLGGLLR
jgi:hypothetical protein